MKFELYVRTNRVGSRVEEIIDLPDEDVPENWRDDAEFQKMMFDMLADSGMFDWGFEPAD